jgi:hypothetical protein
MKKTLLSLLSIVSVVAGAQTITSSNHFPLANNTYFISQCDSTGITGGSATGSGLTWNYALNTHTSTAKTNYVSAVTSNVNYPSATVSVGSATNNVSFYSTDGTKQFYWGGNLIVKTPATSIDLNLKYTSPAVQMIYPATLTTTSNYSVAGTTSLGNFTGDCKTNVDGTGSLILPAKTFTDVIRVKTTENFTITTGFGNAVIDNIKFDYDVVSIKENQQANIELSVFPNPATTVINFNTPSIEALKIVAYDLTGKVVATELLDGGKGKMNTSGLTGGIYLYSVLGKDNQVLKTGKFNVAK